MIFFKIQLLQVWTSASHEWVCNAAEFASDFWGILSLFLSVTVLTLENGDRRKGFWLHTWMGIGFILALWLFGMAVGTNMINYNLFGWNVAAYVTLISIGYLFMAVCYVAAAGLQQQGKTGIVVLLCCAGMVAGCLLFGSSSLPEESYIVKYTAGWLITVILLLICMLVFYQRGKRKSA